MKVSGHTASRREMVRRAVGMMGGGGFACAVQLHREVRPESGLVGIVEHIQVNKR